MLKIRLKRVGAKKQPYYRIVVMRARSPRDGQAIARVGTVDPRKNPPLYTVESETAVLWLQRGAQPTNVVSDIFRKTGVLEAWKTARALARLSKSATEPTLKG